jgi:hypothetical protein
MQNDKPEEPKGPETPPGNSRRRFLEAAALSAGAIFLTGEAAPVLAQGAKTRKSPLTTNVTKLMTPASAKKLSPAAAKLTLADLRGLANQSTKDLVGSEKITVADLQNITNGLLDKIGLGTKLSDVTVTVSCCCCCCCAVASMDPVRSIA